MMERRILLQTGLGIAVGSIFTTASSAAVRDFAVKPGIKSAMKHRAYSGRVDYFTGDNAVYGRETFDFTIQPDGMRTMRAKSELEDKQLLRDVTVTWDSNWCPRYAFAQISRNQQFQGSAWYRFTDSLVECEGYTEKDGRFLQRFVVDHPIAGFSSHPIHSDSMALARIHQARAAAKGVNKPTTGFIFYEFTTSASMDGVGGPRLEPTLPSPGVPPFLRIDYIGPERITVAAGTFDTERFRYYVIPTDDTLDVWAYGEDCIPIRLTSSVRKTRYDLAELSGDPL